MKDFFENLLSNGELQEKVVELQGKIDAYQMSENEANEIIAELKAENDKLKEEIKYLEEEKKEKIQLLERIIKILYPNASDDELFTVTFNSEYIDKLKKIQQTLQEIKAIVCGNYEIIDPQGRKDILKLITKAEEE